MTKQELNERIAEFMGQQKGKDFFVTKHDWEIEKDNKICICKNCNDWGVVGVKTSEYCQPEVTDYTAPENWGKVVEKLLENKDLIIEIIQRDSKGYLCRLRDFANQFTPQFEFYGTGNTIGEAICRAVYEYRKAQEGNNGK